MVLEGEFPPDVRVENEARFLISKGYSVSLLCTSRKKNFVPIEEIHNIKVYRIYQSKFIYKMGALALLFPFYFLFWKRHIKRFLKGFPVDIIHLHDLPLIKVVNNISNNSLIPYVADFHENRPEIMKFYPHTQSIIGKLLISNNSWQRYQKKYSRIAQKLILVTPEAKMYYVKEYGADEERIYVVPNYADTHTLNKFDEDVAIAKKYSSKFTLTYFGDTGLRRGTMTIIETADLLKSHEDIQFVIIGDSKEQLILEKEVLNRNLNNIELTGYLQFDKFISYVKASQVGLCPFLKNIHHDTTYANKMFQTMFFGKPIIASNCTSQENLLTKENAGLIFNSGDAEDFAKQILELKRDENLYSQMSKNARYSVINNYNSDVGNETLLKLYKSIEKQIDG